MIKRVLLWVMAVVYLFAGINHFINPAFYEAIMPAYIPYHKACIAISGIAEITAGIFLLLAKYRKQAAWFIMTMLFAFLIIHIQMIIDYSARGGTLFWIAVVRLPLQFVLMYWAYIYAKNPHLPAGK